ncbi:unnamed protein product [Microthlaspi erraticum]|uniref:Uncharacterized protein n=1 Tax=Microthlaspi erraticum TaxID=1685480 RepID=A0A6D2HKS8_9BRAS|nr:unnamed protein product [Microthlaspi erraticum]
MKWYIQGLVFGYLSAPQRTGRTRSWSGDGRRPSGALHQLGAHSIELAAPLLLFFIQSVGSYSNPGSQTGLLQVNSTVSSIELSFLCLDSIESGGRAGASGLGSLPPSLRVVFLSPKGNYSLIMVK